MKVFATYQGKKHRVIAIDLPKDSASMVQLEEGTWIRCSEVQLRIKMEQVTVVSPKK